MPRIPRRPLLAPAVALTAAGVVACGSQGIELQAADRDNQVLTTGARLFDARCAPCHTLDDVGAQGSAVDANQREYKDGPSFNERKESYEDVLYAIRNGGFSSGPMPQNLVTGEEAEAVARFLEKYSGQDAAQVPTPKQRPTGEQ
jgi:mono/diheme cytochrome c family protein